jgi:hypothetical protein
MGSLWRAFAPELFSAPALQRILDKYRRERLRSVPSFDGLMTGEIDALLESFSGVPEVHHPVRGRIKGRERVPALRHRTNSWLAERNVDVEHVNFVTTDPRRLKRSCSTSTATADASVFPLRSPATTTRRTSASSSCACIPAPGR